MPADNPSMQNLTGIAVSAGVAICESMVLSGEEIWVPNMRIKEEDIELEWDRVAVAIAQVDESLRQNSETINAQLGKEYAAIFDAHRMMLADIQLHEKIQREIFGRLHCAEYAVNSVLLSYENIFAKLNNSHLAERSNDIKDLRLRLLRELVKPDRQQLEAVKRDIVVFAHNLTPSETASLNLAYVKGFATEVGGPGSHTAILAEALQIPAVVGIGPFLDHVNRGDMAVIDGDWGKVVLRPDEETCASFQTGIAEQKGIAAKREEVHQLVGQTLDDTRIEIHGNIEFPHESKFCKNAGADGIGLYRTEFLYLPSEQDPDEETQFRAYTSVLREMGDVPVTIRTFDFGADKEYAGYESESENPALGLRSIRLALRNLPLFRTQLRAILRASAHGNIQVMFPLISSLSELRKAKLILGNVKEDLHDEGIPYNGAIRVGMMVEVPAAAVLIDQFIREVDFVSIGTNDLIQYTLACDRTNKDVAELFSPVNPAILHLLKNIIRAGNDYGIDVSLCGQMSSDPIYTMLLLGMGLRKMSVPPVAIPEVKQVCRQVTIEQCELVAKHVQKWDRPEDINVYLCEQLRRVVSGDLNNWVSEIEARSRHSGWNSAAEAG